MGTQSSWSQHEWHGALYGKGVSMPHQMDTKGVCEAIAGAAEQPHYAFLRLNVGLAGGAADHLPPFAVHPAEEMLPVTIGCRISSEAARWLRRCPLYGGPPDSPRCATSPLASLGKSAAVAWRTVRL